MISNHCEKYELKRVKTFWLPKIKFYPNISKQNSYSLLVTGYIDTNFPVLQFISRNYVLVYTQQNGVNDQEKSSVICLFPKNRIIQKQSWKIELDVQTPQATIFRRDFCDTRNNQGRGKCYQPRPVTLAESSIISNITKISSKNCFIIHCFEENNDKCTVAQTCLTLLLEIMH